MGAKRWTVLAVAGLSVTSVLGGAAPVPVPHPTPSATASGDDRLARMASPSPTRGLIYTGLAPGKDGSACAGVFEAKSRTGAPLGCSHGPDPAPPGLDVRVGLADGELAAAAAGDPTGAIGCIDDGVSGARVQAIYAVAANRTDRSATVIPAIRATFAPQIDWQFAASAAETGGEAHVRFVTEPTAGGSGCQLDVDVVRLSNSGDDTFSNTITELRAKGYDRRNRKYLVWTDANVLCGVANVYIDTDPSPENMNNGGAPMYARVDAGCWGYAEGHELMHTLGAVQEDAPHATANGHCWDEPDELCYDDDGPGPATMVTVCAGRSDLLFDCNHDDYFYAGTPPPGNWLATHWNTYDSDWLRRGPLPDVAVVPAGNDTGGTGTPPEPPDPEPTTTTSSSTTTTTTPPPVNPLPDPPVGPTPVTPAPTTPVTPSVTGYWMLTAAGNVYGFGSAAVVGDAFPLPRGVRAVHLEPTPSGRGYWILDDTGRVRNDGDAGHHGHTLLNGTGGERAVSLSATPSGDGYWVFTNRGRALRFGDAGFFGDMTGVALNQPVIGSVATPSGKGYYMFAADGGIFTFGDAAFHGSTGALRLNRPVVAMAVSPTQGGYSLVAADGGLFAFGDARFYGSLGGLRLNRPVSAVVPGPAGYLMVGEDGGAFSFGDVRFFGSLGSDPPPSPVISVALRG